MEGLQRVRNDDDPNRCQGVGPAGQCTMQAKPGTQYCERHLREGQQRTKNIRMYQLTQFKARFEQFADDPSLKTLREEIAILRMTLENTINICTTQTQLVLNSSKISDMVTRIEKLVVACNSIEAKQSTTMDKAQLLHLVGDIITIIGNHVSGDTLTKISEGILSEVGKYGQHKNDDEG